MKYLVPLQSNRHLIDETCECIDKWFRSESAKQLMSNADDRPQLLHAPSRAENIKDIIGKPFYCYGAKAPFVSREFVVLNENGKVGGYLTFLEQIIEGNEKFACAIRFYRFGGVTAHRFGKAQQELLDYLYDNFHRIQMGFASNGNFTTGKTTIEMDAIRSETGKRIVEARKNKNNGLANGQMLERLQRKYNAVYRPYVSYTFDLNGRVIFISFIEWLGKHGIAAKLPPRNPKFERSQDLIDLLALHRIEV
ncbi:hypothetical protein [Vibrio metschnikovii]|uniref:hypothetical protein n=1 Tax=Vibrio metschnikovii TaxID=28172 RepID=UPI001C30D04B|nr:hypothetical protein [Vibrio metschnikovii]